MIKLIQSRERLYWLLQINGWLLFGALMVLFANVFDVQLAPGVLEGRMLIFCTIGFLLTHLTRLAIKKLGLLKLPMERAWPGLLLSIFICNGLYALFTILALEYFQLFLSPKAYTLSFFQKWFAIFLDNGFIILSWLLLYFFFHYYYQNRQREVDTLKLETAVRELELKTLKTHINPHFIFNSLNSIRALVDLNPARARQAITELSNLLRSSMQTEKAQLVPLRQEMDIIRDYLALESIRFENRLRIEYAIEENTLDLPVPPMMVQTLVENAIKHGISSRIQGGWASISSFIREGVHVLEITNSGNLNSAVVSAGFGLTNTKNRLQILFGATARLFICQKDKDVVLCTVTIPLNKQL
ncbi:MAG: sensor histidine kinase [Bacteroidetes bacterium]|nr:sensor histidine kinase [Bacteroidota bacterium]